MYVCNKTYKVSTTSQLLGVPNNGVLQHTISVLRKEVGRGVLDIMHGRSRMTIDPRIFTINSGTECVEVSPTRHRLLAPSARRRKVFSESHEEWVASYPGPLVRRTCIWMPALMTCSVFRRGLFQRQL